MAKTQNHRILRLPAVVALTGLSRSAIYKKIQAKSFPPPVRMGARAVGWIEEEISEWITSLVNARRGAPASLHQEARP